MKFWQLPTNKLKPQKISNVFNFKNKVFGEVVEISIDAEKGQESTSIDIFIPNISKENHNVVTSGWHTWSGSETRGKDVGIGDFKAKFSKNQTEFVVEPGRGKDLLSKDEGVSYGLVTFRKKDGTENVGVGVIPSLTEIEDIRFKLKDNGVLVTLRKKLERLNKKRKVVFKIFLAKGMYTEIVWRFGEELAKLNKRQLMKDRIIWFSWAAYGKGVRQIRDIEPELPYIAEVGADTIMIDDGWEKVIGQWEVDTDKFPDIIGLIDNMRRLGIKPGVWIAPFMAMRETEIFRLKYDWIIKDKNGKVLNVSNPQVQPTGRLVPFIERAVGLDISLSEVREYLYGEFIRLAKIGFDVFKVDFISIPFIGELTNKEKTAVEYYRLFFNEVRTKVKKATGKDIELIGCGGPMMESIGLFEGIRVSADSAMPNIATLRYYGRLFRIFSAIPLVGRLIRGKILDIHSVMYRDAAAVAFRRALLFGQCHGLLVDGVHLNDPKIYIDKEEKHRVIDALPAFKKFKVLTNLFIGDSLVRAGLKGRLEWLGFLTKYKKGQEAWIEEKTGNVLVNDG